jgi:hypothetical protein
MPPTATDPAQGDRPTFQTETPPLARGVAFLDETSDSRFRDDGRMTGDLQISTPGRAIVAGATTGIALSSLVAIPFFGLAGATPHIAERGATPTSVALMILPGWLMLSGVVSLALSALLVALMTVREGRRGVRDHPIAWVGGSWIVAAPLAWLFSKLETPGAVFEFNRASVFVLLVAAASALMAWSRRTARPLNPRRPRP